MSAFSKTRSQANKISKIDSSLKSTSERRIKRSTRLKTKYKITAEPILDLVTRQTLQSECESLHCEHEVSPISNRNCKLKRRRVCTKLKQSDKSSTSSPLPDLCIEKVKPIVEDIRLTDSESDNINEHVLEPNSLSPILDPNTFNSIIEESVSTNFVNTGQVRQAPLFNKKRKLLSVIHEEEPTELSEGERVIPIQDVPIQSRDQSIKSWISTGLPEDTTDMLINTAEASLRFFETITSTYLTQLRGPLQSNVVHLYETLTTINNSVHKYFKNI